VPWKATFDPAQIVASRVWHKDMLFFLGAWSRGSKMLARSAKAGALVLWETGAKPTTTISTPLFQDDDYLYAILGNGSLACLEAATGKEVWTTREPTSGSFGNAHLTPNGDRVFLFNHTGHLILARLRKDIRSLAVLVGGTNCGLSRPRPHHLGSPGLRQQTRRRAQRSGTRVRFPCRRAKDRNGSAVGNGAGAAVDLL
jgi:hypothetical protein